MGAKIAWHNYFTIIVLLCLPLTFLSRARLIRSVSDRFRYFWTLLAIDRRRWTQSSKPRPWRSRNHSRRDLATPTDSDRIGVAMVRVSRRQIELVAWGTNNFTSHSWLCTGHTHPPSTREIFNKISRLLSVKMIYNSNIYQWSVFYYYFTYLYALTFRYLYKLLSFLYSSRLWISVWRKCCLTDRFWWKISPKLSFILETLSH